MKFTLFILFMVVVVYAKSRRHRGILANLELILNRNSFNKLPLCNTFMNYTDYENDSDCSEFDVFCQDGEDHNKIYGLNKLIQCKNNLFGIHLFELISPTQNKEVNIYNDFVISPTELCLYQCNDNECVQTYGHIKVDTLNDDKTVASSEYFYINRFESGADVPQIIHDSTECSSHIGELVINHNKDGTIEVCISDNYSLSFDDFNDGYEMLSGVAGSLSPYTTNTDTESNFVIILGSHFFILERLFTFFQYGYHIIWYNSYLQCDVDGCEVKTDFLNSCDGVTSSGKLAKIEEDGDTKIYLCSYYDKNEVTKFEIPFYEGEEDEEGKKCVIKKNKFYELDGYVYKANASNGHQDNNKYIKKDKRNNNIFGEGNQIYVIDNGFPGPVDEGKAVVRLSYNTAYAIPGKYGNIKKDAIGNEYISSVISYCDTNEDREYKCVDEKTIPGEYHLLNNFMDKVFYVSNINRMDEVQKEKGYYLNQKEYIIVGDDFTYTINADKFDENEKCFNHSGYIFYDPKPVICLNFTNHIKVNEENSGLYLVMYTHPNPFDFSDYSFRLVTITKNKVSFFETEEEVVFCVDDNWRLSLKEDKCEKYEITCNNSICAEPAEFKQVLILQSKK